MKTLIVILFLLVGGLAGAQKDEGWEKVDGSMTSAPGETIPATALVGGAYGFIFVALVVWVASVAARTRRVEEEVESLRAKLKK
jgi:hypothetical protein